MQAAAESAAAGRERELAQRGPRLSLGLLAPPYLPVPPQRYGDVERVVEAEHLFNALCAGPCAAR
jgi:hypothetical protein